MKTCLAVLMMALALTVDLAAPQHHHHRIRRHHSSHRISRIHDPVSWKTIAAGGAAAGTLVAAYKISDGVEEGMKTVAREKPEVFADILTPFATPLRIIVLGGLIYAGYRIWRWHKTRQKPTTERNLEE